MSESVDLQRLAVARFALLTAAEFKMLHSAASGTTAFCGPSQIDNPANNPADSDNWSADRQIRSDLIRWLCINQAARDCVDPRGIQICGARISGALDLSFATVPFPLRLSRCRLSDNWSLNYIEIPSIQFTGTWVRSLTADVAKVKGSVTLKEVVCAKGTVQLRGAEIAGNLDCSGSTFQNPADANIPDSGIALNAEGAKVGGSVLLNNKFSAEGKVQLFNAQVGGNLNCGSSTFQNSADANIPGSGMALNAEGAKIGGSVFVRYDFSAEGEVSLFNAEIGGDLDCSGGKFRNPAKAIPGSGTALNAVGAKVGDSVFLRRDYFQRWDFVADGAVRLFGAEIGRSLDCNGGKFQNPAKANIPGTGVALDAELAKVGGPVVLNNNFLPEGEVRLLNAQIRGDLSCDGSKSQDPANAKIPDSGVALDTKGIHIEGSMVLREQFRAVGMVNARISGSLTCDEAAFERVDLTDAFVGSIVDDEGSWPKAGNLLLDGFVYGRISGGPLDVSKRLAWIKRQPSFARQPYRQLASVLGNAGDDLGARRILSDMQRTAWSQRQRRWPARLISQLLRVTIGYGYFPLRAVWLILGLVLVGAGVYWVAYNMGSIVPIQKESYALFEKNCTVSSEYEHFHTIPYSLENSFPLIKLGIQDKWAPAPETRVQACSCCSWTSRVLQEISAPGFLRVFRWIQICLGWILTTLFVSGITGILRRN
ncbi:MAG TPA: hypothetical protein VJ875_04645 [Pyrinomonadaceae bacterium]|nr:hypothetical protein [Pyrinomonadaceae bacterium]